MSSAAIKVREHSRNKGLTKNREHVHTEFASFVGVDLQKRVVTLKAVNRKSELIESLKTGQ